MERKLAEELGPTIIEGLMLWRECKELGVDIDDTSEYPDAVHLVLPDIPNPRAEFIFKDDRCSTALSFFLAARHGTFNICFHAANCTCGYSTRRKVMHA